MPKHSIWARLNPWYQPPPAGENFSDFTGPQRVHGNQHVEVGYDHSEAGGGAFEMVCYDAYISSVDQAEPLRGELAQLHAECDAAAML